MITYLFNNPKPIPKINCKLKQKNKQRSKLVIQIPKAYSTNIQFNIQSQNEIRTEIGSKTLNLVQNLIYPLESYGTYMSHRSLQGAPTESSENLTFGQISLRVRKDKNNVKIDFNIYNISFSIKIHTQ